MEGILKDFWLNTLQPMWERIKNFVVCKFKEKPEESFAFATVIGMLSALWLGGYLINNAIAGAAGMAVGILILTKYLPDKAKLFIATRNSCLVSIDIGAGVLAFWLFEGVTGLFAGVFSTVIVTACLGLLAKHWRTSLNPEDNAQELAAVA